MSSRDEFEDWYKREIYSGAIFSADPHGNYASSTCQAHWRAWQASRQALEIQLPQEEPAYMYYAPDVVAAIEAAGLRVKP